MKHIAIFAAFSLTACATTTASPKVRLAEATATHIALCGEVKSAHMAGDLKGEPYEKARTACVTAKDGLNVADAAIRANDTATSLPALQRVNMALAGLRALLIALEQGK